jgi:hypothetical protein
VWVRFNLPLSVAMATASRLPASHGAVFSLPAQAALYPLTIAALLYLSRVGQISRSVLRPHGAPAAGSVEPLGR